MDRDSLTKEGAVGNPCEVIGELTFVVPAQEPMDPIDVLKELQANVNSQGPEEKAARYSQQRLDSMIGFLERIGHKVEDLDKLNIIHVTGTKGKGSTCAFTEQIMRRHGFRTGFFSSPHLIVLRERIRINGEPIGEDLFAKYFWQVYGRLEETKDTHGGTMPLFFPLLTLLAFHVFIEEKVDLAVMEVGKGGTYDCTNIIRNPWVCGIVTLDIDHVDILGDTIEQIAWHKGGIFKAGAPAFTVKQPDGALAVLRDRARERGCPLWVCPDLEDYEADCEPLRLGLLGRHQRTNASLALQLSYCWLQKNKSVTDEDSISVENGHLLEAAAFKLSPFMVKGLAETQWAGRAQTVEHGSVTYFLDGAHTLRSIQACVDWFTNVSAQQEINASGVVRVLLFNTTGQRDSAAFMKLLMPFGYDFVVFCPNNAVVHCDYEDETDKMTRCYDNEKSWHCLQNEELNGEDPKMNADTLVFPSILSALQWITQGRDSAVVHPTSTSTSTQPPPITVTHSMKAKAAPLRDAAEIHIFVTGSLYLVGGVLKLFHMQQVTGICET